MQNDPFRRGEMKNEINDSGNEMQIQDNHKMFVGLGAG